MIQDNSQNIEGRATGKYQLGTFGLYKLFVFLDPGCQNLRFFEVHPCESLMWNILSLSWKVEVRE